MDTNEFYKIAEVEHEHWWYKSLHDLVLKYICKHFNNKNIKIIDACCGTGGLIEYLEKHEYNNTEGFDISETGLQIAKNKGLNVIKADLKNISDYYKDNYADVIICNDALYFFEQNQQNIITSKMYNILKPEGLIIINMPALKTFSCNHDKIVDINKRINIKDIKYIFDLKKFKLISSTYWPFLLSPFIWSVRFIQRIDFKLNKNMHLRSDLKKETFINNRILYFIVNFENKIFNRKPFGSSLFVVLQKI
jgi:ubiquinone/menaquinone biosynthesis C-methylase UbiE